MLLVFGLAAPVLADPVPPPSPSSLKTQGNVTVVPVTAKAVTAPVKTKDVEPGTGTGTGTGSAPAPTPGTFEPTNTNEAVATALAAIEFLKSKQWFGFSAAAIWLIIFILKLTKLFEKIGKRWLYIIVPVLSIAAMLLAKFVGGVSWGNAWLVLGSGAIAGLLNDFIKRGILGKELETPMVVPK